jgi:hypothetical protein
MQTFITNKSFNKSAQVLDNKRLGKQRVETYQIMKALLLPEYGWKNHPAVKMWKGYEVALLEYQKAICEEWMSRGYKDTCLVKTIELYFEHRKGQEMVNPDWITDELITSHRSNLLRKDKEFYGQYWPTLSDNLPYVWPK